MTDAARGPAWKWDPSLFAGCAPFYVRGRVAYPSALAELLVDVLNLDGRGRLLDIGRPGIAHAAPGFSLRGGRGCGRR